MKNFLHGAGMVAAIALTTGAQAQSKYGNTPEDSVTCVQNLSLYQEFMKQSGGEKDAYAPWREVVRVCPTFSKGVYQNGVKILTTFIEEEKDIKDASRIKVGMSDAEVVGQIGAAKKKNRTTDMAGVSEQWVYDGLYVYFADGKVKSFQERPEDGSGNRRQQLIDSLCLVYDLRITHFGERAFVLGRKGYDLLTYAPERCKEAYEILKESIELGGAKSEAGTLSAYYQALNCMYGKGEATKDQMLKDYVMVMEHIDANLADEGLKEERRDYFSKARDVVNSLFFKVADCADIGRIAGEMIQAKPDDMEMKNRLLKVLNGKDCTDEKVYLTIAEDVHRANPTNESAYSLGLYKAKQGDMAGALKYMKEAVDLCSGCSDKVKYLLKAGQVAGASGNHAQARSYANQVLQVEPKNGEALILIGNAIAAQGAGCEAPDSWGAYWLAYDYYQRARSLDPSVADKAGDRMGSMSARFPTQPEAFFHQLTDGKSVTVACGGLGETTTVRTRK